MSMTLEQVRDWLLARAQDGQMQRSVYVSDYQLREMADAIDAHLAQPAQSVDVARMFHEEYERLAPSFGYETRPETRAFNPDSPNGRLMIAVCDKLTAALQEKGNG